jgi:acyl dehydratase
MQSTPPEVCASVGEAFSRRVTFDAASIRDFATRTGDFNPLHHDDEAAARSPFGGLIVSGPHVAALLLGLTATHFSQRCAPLGLDFTVRFVRAIRAGTTLDLRWTLERLEPKGSLAGHLASLAGQASDDERQVYVRATGLLLLRPK